MKLAGIRGILRKAKEKGILHYLKNFYTFGIKKLFPKYRKIFVLELELARFSGKSNLRKDVKIEIAHSTEEIISYIEERGDWYYNFAEKLFSKGNLCFVGKINNEIASCVWTSFNETWLPNVEYMLYVDKDVVPLIDVYTLPKFRNAGILSAVWSSCLKHLQQNPNYSRIYECIEPSNTRSLEVHRKLGLERIIIEIRLFRILGIRKHWIKQI